ncbi:MAG: LysM peptidoglycan-binding domain-containing protein [Kiritimatiellaeota bacterium]|nr:LysM peptidoglycan-binding domain-containing protein [Kiritimatiellota bacterium]
MMKRVLMMVLAGVVATGALAQGRSLMGGGGGTTAGGGDKTAQRVSELEAQLYRLQSQVDGLATTLQQGGVQKNAATKDEVAALRSEVAALRAENQALRKLIDELPAKIAKSVAQSAPAPVQPAKGSGQPQVMTGVEHVVEAGQTLSEIAKAYGVKLDTIVKANNIANPAALKIGQKIFIPQ